MKSGYYIYNNEKYRFELNNEYMTVVKENGIDKESSNMQFLKVKLFPNWNDAIIFHNHNLDSIGATSTFKIFGIIEFKTKEQGIKALNIYSKELEYIYDSSRIFDSFKYDEKGNMNLYIKPFEQVNSTKKQLNLKGKIIDYNFDIKRKISPRDINNYFITNTILKFKWNELVDDYEFVYDIVMTAYKFISYLYYRQNINFENIDLLSKDENDKYFTTAQMTIYINNTKKPQDDYLKKHYIDYNFISTIDNKILQAIIDENIFIRHIPENEEKRNQITPQSFVIVSSAFEWEFKQLFPNGVEHSENKINQITEIKDDLLTLSRNYEKKKVDVIQKIIENLEKDNLESKLIYANKKLKVVSEIFLKYLCKLNSVSNKNKIFTNLQKLRNDFAHGNMDIDIDSDGFLGIIYLERLVYIMQLKRLGLDDENIKKAVNKLFGSNIAL